MKKNICLLVCLANADEISEMIRKVSTEFEIVPFKSSDDALQYLAKNIKAEDTNFITIIPNEMDDGRTAYNFDDAVAELGINMTNQTSEVIIHVLAEAGEVYMKLETQNFGTNVGTFSSTNIVTQKHIDTILNFSTTERSVVEL